MALAPQICRKHIRVRQRAGNYMTWLKTQLNRLMRRQARRDPEDAPRKRRYSGWGD